MNQQILARIKELGGNIDNANGTSFQEYWQSIKFNHPLFDKEWDVYGIDKFYESNTALYESNEDAFYNNLIGHYFSDHELPYGQDFFRDWLFTPFKKDSKDAGELDGLVTEDEIRNVVQGTSMDFICIFYTYGFPDYYFVCLTDPNQSNPTVYSTDHEVYFQEIENEGPLDKFLEKYMTKAEFLAVVKEYIKSKFGR